MRFVRLFLLLLLGFCPVLPTGAQDQGLVKVAFWNVQWFPGGRPNATQSEQMKQSEAVLRTISGLAPDILGLMEIRDLQAAEGIVPGMKVDVCSRFIDPATKDSTFQQIVLASKYPPVSAWWEPWKEAGVEGTRRGFDFAAYEPRPGNILLVYAIHLKSNRGALGENIPNREETIRQFLEHQLAMEKAYAGMGAVTIVVGGDFNTSADDPRFRHEITLRKMVTNGFAWSWVNIPFSKRITLPGSGMHPDACFDHIFVRGGTIESAEVIVPGTGASDHRPVVAQIRLPGPSAPAP